MQSLGVDVAGAGDAAVLFPFLFRLSGPVFHWCDVGVFKKDCSTLRAFKVDSKSAIRVKLCPTAGA